MNQRIIHITAFIVLCCAVCFAQHNNDPVARALGGLRGHVLVAADAEYPKNGEGSTIKLKDGALLHLVSRHQRDAKESNSDLWPSVIAQTVSRDGGVTWSKPEVLFRSTTGRNAMQPSLVRLPNGALGVSYSQIDSEARANKVFRISTDEGRSWSEPRFISPTDGYWTSAHDRLTVLSTGRVIHPLHVKVSVKPRKMVARIAYSDDNGQTWRIAPQTLAVEEVLPAFKEKFPGSYISVFAELTIVERADKSLLMYGRTLAGRQWQCVSTDGGATWTQPAPSPLISAAAPARLHRIPNSNDLLVVWNSCCLDPQANGLLGQRLTLSSAISTDGGQTWRWQREIESITPGPENRVEYPAITIEDGKVYLSYRAMAAQDGGGFTMHEYISVLPLAWFYAERDRHRPEAALGKTKP
ncbi:MAG: sialidase family protein [Blastocatellia bacterium]